MAENADTLKKLKMDRGRQKTAVTKFTTIVNDTRNLPRPLGSATIIKIETQLERIIPKCDEFTAIHYQICGLQDEEDEDELLEFENAYFDVVANAKVLVQEYYDNRSRLEKLIAGADDARDQSVISNLSTALAESKIRLPTISLPHFDGKPEHWLEFRDVFRALIHNDESLNDIKRFHYLKSSLQGDAKQVIHGIETSADNYQVAWGNLCERYENKRLLIQNHLGAIHNLAIIHKESAASIRDLLDALNQHLRALQSLGEPVEHWDTIIIFIVCSKLDPTTVRDWELLQNRDQMPTLKAFRSFLQNKASVLESLQYKRDSKQNKSSTNKTFAVSNYKCYHCDGEHPIYACIKFKKLSAQDRIKEVARLKLCSLCLRSGHQPKNCSFGGCRICQLNHNSLLHVPTEGKAPSNAEPTVTMLTSSAQLQDFVLISTALVNAVSKCGKNRQCRVLLDNASQNNLITERMVKRLGLRYQQMTKMIGGVYDCATSVKGQCPIEIRSKDGRFAITINCLVLPEISDTLLPQCKLPVATMPIPSGMVLADPNFGIPDRVDMLLGASNFWQLIRGEVTKLCEGETYLINTHLGWIVSGSISSQQIMPRSKCFYLNDNEICDNLSKFWQIEEFPATPALSDEEKYCEENFLKTTKRNDDGRFQVGIPFKLPLENLGFSRAGAEARFIALERRLSKNKDLNIKYSNFMREYESIGHMTCVSEINAEINPKEYFLPHHGVVNENSSTTKLRVVFDGSFATTTGFSRNNLECVGPMLQNDLLSILLRFRSHKIAIGADIEKMYRQVQVRPEDRCMQKIFWRDNPASSIKTFELNTVTYGTASASFLATRCLIELANENMHTDPALATVIRDDFYVDDLLTGVDTEAEGGLLCEKLNETLNSACFPLRKWTSNNQTVLSNVLDPDDPERMVKFGSGERTKTLGLYWLPYEDYLNFTITADSTRTITKRSILSSISQVFDPLGLVGACIVTVKIMLQELWRCKLNWDSDVPVSIAQSWMAFQANLKCLNNLQIPRFIMSNDTGNLQLHGFADASEQAYGACIYVRSQTMAGNVSVHLLCAKSKVAPLKTLTIPRLELCAALILAKLVQKVCNSLRIEFNNIYLWSDSTIVLNWLKKPPNLLKIFVANRVAKIVDNTVGCNWNHVPTADNPADLISRGLQPSEIIDSSSWWHGPPWLLQENNQWPSEGLSELSELPETRSKVFMSVTPVKAPFEFSRFSNYQRLVRTVAYVLRFTRWYRDRKDLETGNTLSCEELAHATQFIIRLVQREAFMPEIDNLQKGKPLRTSSKILSLTPFLDKEGLLRVGGRLQNSSLSPDAKHPILLPSGHAFTKILLQYEHKRLGHAGPQLLLCSIRDRFWPLRGRSLVRETLRNCVPCFKAKPFTNAPQMGNLPAARVRPSFAFETTGIDYAGPFIIKDRKGRGCKTSKCYIALFICFSTKAIHLEVVSDLSTETFIASLKRFISRRGRPNAIWSDNGTNFVGANSELRRIIQSLNTDTIQDAFSGDAISWKFIPANSPHFGGLWESGVRGTKFHLKRMLANASLTFEELSTVCCCVESFLNSRPLIPLSDNPNDLEALTPSHFLIGRKLTGLPEDNMEASPINRLSRFQLVQQLAQHFWRRWTSEYLHTLQSRTKWKAATATISVGSLVLIKDDNYGPLKWPLARVTDLHPGKDGIVRVVTLRTSRGVLKRAVTKVFPLPNQDLGSA